LSNQIGHHRLAIDLNFNIVIFRIETAIMKENKMKLYLFGQMNKRSLVQSGQRLLVFTVSELSIQHYMVEATAWYEVKIMNYSEAT
jgi:hypothetical protein